MTRIASILTICMLVTTAGAEPISFGATDAGTIYLGAVANLDWGRPLTSGDLDGDGYDEIIVGASESWGGHISKVFVLRGAPTAHGLGTVDLYPGQAHQVILGAAVDDNLGASITTGDFNGDSIDDLLMCASMADYSGTENCGIAYLIFGGAGFFDSPTRDLAETGTWDLRIVGPVTGGDMGGSNLFGGLDTDAAAIGYLNDDSYGDIVLGVHLADGGGSESGRVYVLFGSALPSGFTLNLAVPSNYGVRIDGQGTYDELGTVVLTGDLTGDGIEELILPNEYASQGLFTSEGAVHIFRGRDTWANLYSLASSPADITLLGAREDDVLGIAAATGDFDNDGIGDLVVSATGADAGAWNDQRGDGFVYGLLGSTAYQTGTHTIDYATATPDFLMIGEFEENLGAEISSGDFNGDGYDDIAASERFSGPQTNGVVEVLFGRDFATGDTYTANVDTDLHIVGAAQDRIGFSLAAANVNGDGLDEIVFGTPFNNNNRGTAYVFTYVSGDDDFDHDLDLADFAAQQRCFTGPTPAEPLDECVWFDFDLDLDIDADDFTVFESIFSGPGY